MKFEKWSGLGNDFIFTTGTELPPGLDARKLCDRKNGIGADGVILISPRSGNEFGMRIINADNSEAAMCGNASRCAAKFLHNHHPELGTAFKLRTISRTVAAEVRPDGLVTVDMGKPEHFLGRITLAACGKTFQAETVSMGNPHAVIFVENMDAVELEKWGPVLEHDAQFPDRCNIEFLQRLSPEKFRMRVWERGCGVTAACGTGSCASMVAARACGLAEPEAEIILDGGVLFLRHDPGGPVFMTGDAQLIFTGEI